MKDIKKEDALDNFFKMLKESWTWEKLDTIERNTFLTTLKSPTFELHGDYGQRFQILNNYYQMFLLGLGYTPIGWRE